MSPLALALAVWLAVACVYRILALSSLAKLSDPRSMPPDDVPPDGELVALRPLHGAPPAFERSLESLLRAGERAGTRVLLGVESPADPALGVAQRVMARCPNARAELRVSRGPDGLNRKVANLIQLSAGVDAEFVLLTDADIAVPEDYAKSVTRPFKDTEVGLVTGPYRSVPARGVASRLDALVTNTHFVPSTCVSARFEGLHFALGASIAVRGEALARAGGFGALLPLPADDYGLAHNIERAGYKLAWVPLVVDHVLEDEGLRRVVRRHLRWSRVVRASRPIGYFGQLGVLSLPPALALAALGSFGGGPGWLVLVGWWALQALTAWPRRRLLGLAPVDLLLLPLADGLATFLWAGGLVGRPEPPEADPA